jgi:glycosyltransferase involved in cell wall biosynthesis
MNKKYEKNPLISVVIPVYNRENLIQGCLKSVTDQTYANLEIIVVDDKSTDKTIEKINEINDERIRVVKLEKNGGAQVARNRGIKESKGEWIAFHDSDDTWDLTKIEKQVKILEENNFDPYLVVHSDANKLENNEYTKIDIRLTKGYVYKQLLKRPGPLFPVILTSKLALEKIGYLDEKVLSYQEWDTSIRLAKICKFVHIKEPLFTYLIHTQTISNDKRHDIRGYEFVINKFKKEIIKNCGHSAWYNHLNIQLKKSISWNLDEETRKYKKLVIKYRFNIMIAKLFGRYK